MDTGTIERMNVGKPTIYASFIKRALALLIDIAVIILVSTLAASGLMLIIQTFFTGVIYTNSFEVITTISTTTFAVISICYFVLCESSKWQGTLGKRVTKMKITDMKGRKLGFLRLALRTIIKLITVFGCLGFVFAFFTKRKQALHDVLLKTVVVYYG